MTAKTIADVLGLGTRYAENGNNDYIAYRYSDLKQALIELVKTTQRRSEIRGGVAMISSSPSPEEESVLVAIEAEGSVSPKSEDVIPDVLVQALHEKLDDIFSGDDDGIEIIEDDGFEIEVDPEAVPVPGYKQGVYDDLWLSFTQELKK